MDLKKILGAGGQGVACLFDRTEADGSKHPVVVKASLNGAEFENELDLLRVSASHDTILQTLGLEAMTDWCIHIVIALCWRESYSPAPLRA